MEGHPSGSTVDVDATVVWIGNVSTVLNIGVLCSGVILLTLLLVLVFNRLVLVFTVLIFDSLVVVRVVILGMLCPVFFAFVLRRLIPVLECNVPEVVLSLI